MADHQTQYLHGETEQTDADICAAFKAASVEQGERAYPCEATAMSTFFDTYMFYTDKSEAFKSIYLNMHLKFTYFIGFMDRCQLYQMHHTHVFV